MSLKDLGVAVPLAALNADSIEPTANMAITSMLADIVFCKSSSELLSIFGAMSAKNYCRQGVLREQLLLKTNKK